MIILDTNVLSELMKPAPDEDVTRWMASQPASSVYTTSLTQAEVLYGIAVLPAGARRSALEAAAEAMFAEELSDRILAFGADAARPYARIAAERRRAGRPISQFDAQIAAIARSSGAALATRNVADYDGCGVKLINPWEERA